MTLSSTLGSTGTIIGILRALPQLLRLVRTREAFGVSVDTAATSSIVSFGWAAYGMMTGQIYVSLATGSSGIIFALIVFAALRYGRKTTELKISPAWFVVLLFSGLAAQEKGLGVALPISVLAANLPQLWVAYKEGNLTDLSLGTWLLSVTDGLVWGLYAILEMDFPIFTFAIFQLVTSGIIVMLKITRGQNQMVK